MRREILFRYCKFRVHADLQFFNRRGAMDSDAKTPPSGEDLRVMRSMSPKRMSTAAGDVEALVAEQLDHYQIDPNSEFGAALSRIVKRLYECSADLNALW